MSPEVLQITEALGVTVIPTEVYRGRGETCASATLQRLFDRHGPGHFTVLLRSLAETGDNDRAIVRPTLQALNDLMLAHPTWPTSTAWLDALDSADVAGMLDLARENRGAVALRPAVCTMLYLH